MLNIKLFSQNDPKWKNDQHGSSSSTVGETGCTITAIASMLVHAGYDTDPGRLNRLLINAKGYSNGNLVIWSKIESLFPNVKFIGRYDKYNNDLARQWIKEKGIIPIIEVGAAPIGGAPGGKHWVDFVGDMKSMDPWTGSIVDTSTWSPSGMALYEYVPGESAGDPEVSVKKSIFSKLVHNSDLADKVVRKLELGENADEISFETVEKSLNARDGKLTNCTNTLATREKSLSEAIQEVENRKEQISRVTQTLTDERDDWKERYNELKKTQSLPDTVEKNYQARMEDLTSKLELEAKAKGRALNDVARLTSELESAKKDALAVIKTEELFGILITRLLKGK